MFNFRIHPPWQELHNFNSQTALEEPHLVLLQRNTCWLTMGQNSPMALMLTNADAIPTHQATSAVSSADFLEPSARRLQANFFT